MKQRIVLTGSGEREIHAADTTGNYATLCGLDGEENETGTLRKGERINCHQCIAIWLECKLYYVRDFDPCCLKSVKGRAA